MTILDLITIPPSNSLVFSLSLDYRSKYWIRPRSKEAISELFRSYGGFRISSGSIKVDDYAWTSLGVHSVKDGIDLEVGALFRNRALKVHIHKISLYLRKGSLSLSLFCEITNELPITHIIDISGISPEDMELFFEVPASTQKIILKDSL